MSSSNPADRSNARGGNPPREEQDYVRGYEEGARSALMEVMSYIAKGHTASEVRFMAETRLSHLRGELEERRQAILRGPATVPKSTLLPSHSRSAEGDAAAPLPPPMPGYSYLFLRDGHQRAREFVRQLLEKGLPAVLITRQPQDLPPVPSDAKVLTLVLDARNNEEWQGIELSGKHPVPADSSAITGIVTRFLEGAGPQVACYWECFEFFVSERNYEQSLKLVHWLNSTLLAKKGVLALSVDPGTLSQTQLRNLRVDFNLCDE